MYIISATLLESSILVLLKSLLNWAYIPCVLDLSTAELSPLAFHFPLNWGIGSYCGQSNWLSSKWEPTAWLLLSQCLPSFWGNKVSNPKYLYVGIACKDGPREPVFECCCIRQTSFMESHSFASCLALKHLQTTHRPQESYIRLNKDTSLKLLLYSLWHYVHIHTSTLQLSSQYDKWHWLSVTSSFRKSGTSVGQKD